MIGILIITVVSFICGIFIMLVSDTKKGKDELYLKYLPGYNCGACGYGSCKGMSEAMEKDIMCYKKCKPLRGEAKEKMEEFVKNAIDTL